MNYSDLEEGKLALLDFEKIQKIGMAETGVIPAVAQDSETGLVLIIGYASKEAIYKSLEEKIAVFFSTSRNELWRKGATSGDVLQLHRILINCEQNSVLYQVTPVRGRACHTKDLTGKNRKTCFYRELRADGLSFIK